MLSQHDRRALADIEHHLRDNDPAFVRRLEHPNEDTPAHAGRRQARRRIILAGVVAGLILLTVAFSTRSADTVVLGVVVLIATSVAAAVWAVARFRHHRD